MSDTTPADGAARDETATTVPLTRGLSTKLLVLTILFVMMAEVLIFLPSIANFKLRWLEERLGTAAAVSVVLLQGDPQGLSRAAQNDVLMAIGAKAIAVRDAGVSRLLVVAEMPPEVDEHINLAAHRAACRHAGRARHAGFGGQRMLRVFGEVGESDKEFELIIPTSACARRCWSIRATWRCSRSSSRCSRPRWSIRPSTGS